MYKSDWLILSDTEKENILNLIRIKIRKHKLIANKLFTVNGSHALLTLVVSCASNVYIQPQSSNFLRLQLNSNAISLFTLKSTPTHIPVLPGRPPPSPHPTFLPHFSIMSDIDYVPSWVPEIAPGVRADVYPVDPSRPSRTPYCDSPPELILDRQAVTSGYSERRLPYEFASCLPSSVTSLPPPPLSSALPGATPPAFNPASGTGLSTPDLLKLRTGIAQLRRSRPTKLQRVEQHTYIPPKPDPAAQQDSNSGDTTTSFGSKKNAFPVQKYCGASYLEEWFDKLSNGACFTTSDLSGSVPLGPAIVRAAGKVIEMMATRSVPTQRAAWYIRVAVLNECVKEMRPDRPPPSPRTFWTKQLCSLLKADIDAIRARKTVMLGSMDRVSFWDYVLDLARWQADEDLLDCHQWLARIAPILKTELMFAQTFNSPGTRIAISAVRRFLPEFLSSRADARLLLESLLPGADAIVKAWRGATQVALKGEAGVSGGQGKKESKSIPRKGPMKRPPFVPNLCHREVTMLLSAMVRFLDDNVVGGAVSETKMSDLERFVKRGIAIILRGRNPDNVEAKRSVEKNTGYQFNSGTDRVPEVDVSSHRIMRELEMLPGHGDVAKVTAVLHSAAVKHGGIRSVVKQVCEWVVVGPVSDRAEAVCVGSAVLAHLASEGPNGNEAMAGLRNSFEHLNEDIHKPRGDPTDVLWAPPLQREIWLFLKEFSRDKKVSPPDAIDHVVRFIAQLCRTGQLSLRVLVRDISRLSSHSHPGSGYLIKCLSLLPDPVALENRITDTVFPTSLDCRRPLLRKFGFASNSRQKEERGVHEQVLEAVFNGDLVVVEQEANKLIKTADTNRILTTAEAVRLSSVVKILERSETGAHLYTIPSFMLMAQEPASAVLWLLGNLSDIVEGQGDWAAEIPRKKKNDVLVHFARLAEDLSRYIAASGLLEEVFYLLKKVWLTSWVSQAVHKRILLTNAALAKNFVGNVESTCPYWSKMVSRHLRQKGDNASVSKLIPLAIASMRGQLDGKPPDDLKFEDILNSVKKDFITTEEDLSKAIAYRHLHGTPVEEVRSAFLDTSNQFPLDSYFSKGFTMNDLFTAVFIPTLAEALTEPAEGSVESTFARLVLSCLQLIGGRQDDVRLHGVRPYVLLEFIALITTGCLSEHTEVSESLELLVGMRWVWQVLAPNAGISLSRRLRTRVDHYCDRIESVDKSVVSAILFNIVARFSGNSSRDEAVVSTALGSEPFGMTDMQLSLLATHRRERGEDEEFGSQICNAAISLVCPDRARTLASVALQCCTLEESKYIVAGLVGFGAVQAMTESLRFVVEGLTLKASRNDEDHQHRVAQWYQADTARRSILECIVESLSQEVGVQVDTMLFDQLASATTGLTSARDRDCMPSSLLQDGWRISDALESRLRCILRSQKTPQSIEVWTQRTLQTAELLRSAVPVMKKSALKAISNVLTLCVKNLADCSRPVDSTSSGATVANQLLDAVGDAELKQELKRIIKPVMYWVEEPDRKAIAALVQLDVDGYPQKANIIQAYNADGTNVDSWVLLEGYGRGPDEDAAIPPESFRRQGATGAIDGLAPVIQLKRTYSTFSSLTV